MSLQIVTVPLRAEDDVVGARQRARDIARMLGFDLQDQTRIATAVSEIARNAFTYAGGGKVEFLVDGRTSPQVLTVRVSDTGPGIRDVAAILAGDYRSPTGMGLGIVGARRLMDQFLLDSAPGRGTAVTLKKLLPARAPLVTLERLGALVGQLAQRLPDSPLEEVRRQNQELLHALDEVRRRQDELARLNDELEDTNRGVVALYAELAEKADDLRQADELKTRFLSNMSHEFRTPLHSILALSQILLSGVDGELGAEQEKQVGFIRKAAHDLAELVDDLLDLAKVQAGKIVVRPGEFGVADVFSALRGMLRPLLVGESVRLVFEDVESLPRMNTDEGKVSQILRNLVSNALKFTERGEVRVGASLTRDGEAIRFSVTDTGIGIAAEDLGTIFKEFGQLEGPLQKRVKGTGLGLPLTKKLTELLGGSVSVESEVGVGSTFEAIIPLVYRTIRDVPTEPAPALPQMDPHRVPILLVEDDHETLVAYQKFLQGSVFQPCGARSMLEAEAWLRRARPAAVVLDIRLGGGDSWQLLSRIKGADSTRDVPVIVVTHVEDEHKAMALGADVYQVKPIDREWLLSTLLRLAGDVVGPRVLMIDDDPGSRYILRQLLPVPVAAVLEASTGAEGVAMARRDAPDIIFLDLVMPGTDGEQVLDVLKGDARTADIPVVVFTSAALDVERRHRLAARAVGVVSKEIGSLAAAHAALRETFRKAGLVAHAE